MSTEKLTIRWATKDDALFVARGITMALHLTPKDEELQRIALICKREDVLYSYRHCMIAEQDGTLAGICLCYDGTGYHEIKERTFALFPDSEEEMDFAHFEDETGEGEYYIDSLAVLPEFRGKGIARALMLRQIEHGRGLGIPVATLLVDPDNPSAQQLYRSLGFTYSEDIYAFGQIYWKWEYKMSDK